MELIIAREVIWAWNEQHALERKQILLPLYRKEAHESCPGDLLIAFFCASAIKAQSPERKDVSAAIEQHLEAGRPVLIYFSEARVDLEEVSFEQEEELFRLGKRYGGRAKIDAYGNDKEFRAKLTRDLEASLAEHAHFQLEARSSETVAVAPPVVTPPAPPPEKKLSEHAVTLLSEACEDFEAYIGRNKIGTTLKIQANGKQLVNHGDPDDAARWDSAVQELISGAYIHDVGYNGQLFQITGKGFAFLKSIGKTPVGYIAEMGGM